MSTIPALNETELTEKEKKFIDELNNHQLKLVG